MTGVVAAADPPGPDALSIEGRTRFNYLIADFAAGNGARLSAIMRGQVVTMSCASTRTLAGTTILSGCQLL